MLKPFSLQYVYLMPVKSAKHNPATRNVIGHTQRLVERRCWEEAILSYKHSIVVGFQAKRNPDTLNVLGHA